MSTDNRDNTNSSKAEARTVVVAGSASGVTGAAPLPEDAAGLHSECDMVAGARLSEQVIDTGIWAWLPDGCFDDLTVLEAAATRMLQEIGDLIGWSREKTNALIM